jgi:hypothetical protein
MGSSLDTPLSTKTWALWLGATVGTFAALEAHAVSTRRQPTLSHALRVWLGIEPVKRHRWLTSLAFAGFFSWLVLHVTAGVGRNLKQHGGTP